MTETMGQKYINNKVNFTYEKVRIALANVTEPLDCTAQGVLSQRLSSGPGTLKFARKHFLVSIVIY